MRILLTGHKGYIGAVAAPMLQAAGHDVVGIDSDLYAGCDLQRLAKYSDYYCCSGGLRPPAFRRSESAATQNDVTILCESQ